jgi:hypothetical protein
MVDPVTKLTPYEVVFGRERALAGLPWDNHMDCPSADTFFEKMADLDVRVAELLNEEHAKLTRRLNVSRSNGEIFVIGDWVWYLRPKKVGGHKLQSWWQGPAKVQKRVGERSYLIRTTRGEEIDVHQDQLKICHWDRPGELIADLRHPGPCPPADPSASFPREEVIERAKEAEH